jgi:hypothetical protein
MYDSGRARTWGKRHAKKKNIAWVVDGPDPIFTPCPRHALLMPTQRRNVPPSLGFLSPPCAGKEKHALTSYDVRLVLPPVPRIFSHDPAVLLLVFSDTFMIAQKAVSTLLVYATMGPDFRAMCRCNNPKHTA